MGGTGKEGRVVEWEGPGGREGKGGEGCPGSLRDVVTSRGRTEGRREDKEEGRERWRKKRSTVGSRERMESRLRGKKILVTRMQRNYHYCTLEISYKHCLHANSRLHKPRQGTSSI